MNSNKKFYTRDYILNKDIVYQKNKKVKKEKVKQMSNNQIVYNNIMNGGQHTQYLPRTTINENMCQRAFTTYSVNPCNYVEDVRTGFYIRHGDTNHCSKYWSC